MRRTGISFALICAPFLIAAPALADDPPSGPAAPPAAEAQEEAPKITFTPYGYLKLDAAWDSDAIDSGDFARWVVSPDLAEQNSQFNLTARQTRLGLRIAGGGKEGFEARGRFEIDFYGGGAENKNLLMLRHAYMELDWIDTDLVLLAGQASDLISPAVPTTVNYTVAWWVGNIGYRRPQVRLTKSARVGADSELTLAIAATRTVGDDFLTIDPGDSGSDAGFPTTQGRLALVFPVAEGRRGTFGFSAHWGRESLIEDLEEGAESLEIDTWSAGFDVNLPISSSVTFKAEGWTGSNLDDYFGGIGQGVNFTLGKGVRSTGGWGSIELRPAPQSLVSFGAGIDDPVDSDLGASGRTKNFTLWGNFIYDITPHVRTGIELSYWETQYKELEEGSAFRVQGTFMYIL